MSTKKKSLFQSMQQNIKEQDKLTEKELEERGQERLPAMPEDEPAKPKKKAAPKKKEKAEPSPAAVSVESTSTGAGEEPAKVMGQPRKYNEPLKHIGFKIPVSANDKLRVLSQLHGQTTTQYLLKWIDEEYEKNKEAIDAIMKFRKEV